MPTVLEALAMPVPPGLQGHGLTLGTRESGLLSPSSTPAR
jgi:hypothetical protein